MYILNFNTHPLSKIPQDWGAFGDFIGGLLNPIISFSALILLMRTIKQNDIALGQSRKALEHNEITLDQNKKALIANTEEMSFQRIELENSVKAQHEIINLEKEKLKDIRTEKNIADFKRRIQFTVGSVKEKLNTITLKNFQHNSVFFDDLSNVSNLEDFSFPTQDNQEILEDKLESLYEALNTLCVNLLDLHFNEINHDLIGQQIEEIQKKEAFIHKYTYILQNLKFGKQYYTSKIVSTNMRLNTLLSGLNHLTTELKRKLSSHS